MDGTDVITVIDHLKDVLTPIGVHVYEVYYKQIVYTGIMNSTMDLIIIFIGLIVGYKGFKYHKSHYNNDSYDPMLAIVCMIVFIIFIILGTAALFEHLMYIINPDYYIIQDLLGNI